MRKITKEEYEAAPITGRGGRSALFRALLALEPGEGLELEVGEWNKNYPPTRIAKAMGKKHGRTYRGGRNAKTQGWMLQRLS